MRTGLLAATFALLLAIGSSRVTLGDDKADGWRALPLIKDGKVDPAWSMIGYGELVVDDGALRTESDERGLGLLLYRPEKFGDCQIRVVWKTKDARSNSGVYVRIADGILDQLKAKKHEPARREAGKLTAESETALKDASEKDVGPWYAVHHGFEVQITDGAGDKRSRTGAIYSLAESSALSDKKPDEWKTMVITLDGNKVLVDVDGKRVTTFDSDSKDLPPDRVWYQPKREPKRPAKGYIGLQTHDPGDVVYFKEISVRSLPKQK